MTDLSLIFLDIETTGLDPDRHDVWEIAYAVDDGPIWQSIVMHHLRRADHQALLMGRYEERAGFVPDRELSDVFEYRARIKLDGATVVGANPAFDAAFLRTRWGYAPWYYRLLDVETYAMPALGLDRPRGLAYIAEQLGVTAPDHSAAGDVAAVRDCFHRLRRMYEDLDFAQRADS